MPWRGFEPRRLSAPPPQDGVSTSFTTRACNSPFTAYTAGPTGLEPATSRVTVECSNQTELRPLTQSGLAWRHLPPPIPISCTACHRGSCLTTVTTLDPSDSPYGSRTRLCTVKGCRPKPIDERAAPTNRIAVTGF